MATLDPKQLKEADYRARALARLRQIQAEEQGRERIRRRGPAVRVRTRLPRSK